MAITIVITATISEPLTVIPKTVRRAEKLIQKTELKYVPEGAYSVRQYLSMIENEYRRSQRLAIRNIKLKTVVMICASDLNSYNNEDYEVVVTCFSRYL